MAAVRYLVHDVDLAIGFYTCLGFALPTKGSAPAMAIRW